MHHLFPGGETSADQMPELQGNESMLYMRQWGISVHKFMPHLPVKRRILREEKRRGDPTGVPKLKKKKKGTVPFVTAWRSIFRFDARTAGL